LSSKQEYWQKTKKKKGEYKGVEKNSITMRMGGGGFKSPKGFWVHEDWEFTVLERLETPFELRRAQRAQKKKESRGIKNAGYNSKKTK